MLELLRRGSQTWVVKGLLILLVLSFGVWGVSASLVPGTSDAVVTVGDVKVTPADFRLAYERQVSQISRQFGTRLTREQAKAFGIEGQVYAQLVAGATLDQLSETMNLGFSQDRLATLISQDPAFRGVNGQFDRQTFSSVLRNAGLREQDYIKDRSQVAVRSQVVEAVSDGYTPPKIMTDALRKYRNEARSIDYLLLSNANIEPVKAPADAVLKPWFENRKATYRAPEFRKVSYVKLEPSDVADPQAVTEEEIRAEYDKRKEAFRTPETRTVEQLAFPSRQQADEALAQLAAGTSFDAIVAAQGKTSTDVLLGDFTRDAMPDPEVAKAAFAVAADGATTPVVVGSFGPVILRVTNIKRETVRTLDEVRQELRQDLALARAGDEIMAIHDKFEDARVSGGTMKEAADQTNLKLVTVPAIDATGLDPDGTSVALPQEKELLTEVFKADVGAETLPVNLGREGYVWFDVEDVMPARERTLDEAREKAVADWTAEQQKTALSAKAAELKARVEKGETLETIAGELGIAVETKTGLRRASEDPGLGPAAVAAAFSGSDGLVASARGADDEGQVLLKVTAVDADNPGDALDNDDSQINAMAQASGDDILDQMVAELQKGYGVSINTQLADRALSQ